MSSVSSPSTPPSSASSPSAEDGGADVALKGASAAAKGADAAAKGADAAAKGASAAAKGAGAAAKGGNAAPVVDGEAAPESREVDPRAVRPPTNPPPLSKTLNQRAERASKRKEERDREAEEDRQFIAKAQQGDLDAFRQLVDRHQRRAFGVALGLVRDENDAHELVQDAFLRVYRGLATFQNNSSFFTWLYRIVTNLAIDLIRKPGRQLVDIDEERFETDEQDADFPLISKVDGADPIDVVRRQEIAGRLKAALDALPDYHRDVILMREIDGLSYEEMAANMGVSKGTIMSRLFHARRKLQGTLADCYKEQIGEIPPESTDEPGLDGGDA